MTYQKFTCWRGNLGVFLAIASLSSFIVRADLVYEETFGNPSSTTRASANSVGWQLFNANGVAVANGTGSSYAVDTVTGRPAGSGDVNVNAGPNSDGTTGSLDRGEIFWAANQHGRLLYTPEYSFNPFSYLPGSLVFSWYQGNA